MSSITEVSEVLAVLLEMFPAMKRRLDEDARYQMFKAYYLALHDLDLDGLRQVCAHLGSNRTFFPAAGEIRGAYYELLEGEQGVPAAQDAWLEVKRLFRRGFSRYHVPMAESMSHPLVWQALEGIGGFLWLCDSDNEVADRSQFYRAYEVYLKRARESYRMLPEVREAVKRLASGAKRLGEGE